MERTAKKAGKESPSASRTDFFFLGLVLTGLIFYFWNFTSPDMLSDSAIYSFRALGWLDYVGGTLQTTPLQWFSHIPWWANLSFHDAPPLVFAIQHFFFSAFGPSVFAARLPFALAGFSLIFVLYFIIRQFKSEGNALFAAFLLAVSSYGIWASRAGYLEGIEALFIGLSFLFFIRYLKSGMRKDMLWWGAFAGMSLLSKYTALFILPAAGLYILLWKRELLKRRLLWIALALMFALLSPVIVYNLEVYHARGHFDAAISSMVGMHPEDFSIISGRGIGTNLLQNARDVFISLSDTLSLGLFVSTLLSLAYALARILRKKADPLERFLFLNIFFAFLLFCVSGAPIRFLSIMVPFLTASVALFFSGIFVFLKERRAWLGFAFSGVVAFIVMWEMLYAANMHLTVAPFSSSPLLSSPSRLENVGFNQLEEYMSGKVYPHLPDMQRPETPAEVESISAGGPGKDNIVFFDEAVHWFAYTWYLQKYVYYRLPVVSLDNYLHSLKPGTDPLSDLKQFDVKGIYYFLSVSDKVLDPVKKKNPDMLKLGPAFAKYLEENHYKGEDILDGRGDVAFKAYYIPLH